MKKTLIALLVVVVAGAGGYFAYDHYYDVPQGTIFEVVKDGTPRQIKKLVKRGADVNSFDEKGRPLLMLAISKPDNAENIKTLIDLGADIKFTEKGVSPLSFAAITQSDLDLFKEMIAKGANVKEEGENGNTPLMMASAMQKNPEVVKLLIENGADVNAVNAHGQSPLMFAVELNKNPEVTKVLIEFGANVNHKSYEGRSVVISAALFNNVEALKVLINAGGEINQFEFMASIYNNFYPEIIDVLAQKIGDLNFIDDAGNSPLMLALAVEEPNPEMIKVLVMNGADINFADKNGRTPLMRTVARSNEPYALRILEQTDTNFDIDSSPDEMKEAIIAQRMQRRNVNLTLIEVLLSLGAEVNLQDSYGMTALMYAAITGKDGAFHNMLTNIGTDVNLKNNDGKTAYDLHEEWMDKNNKMLQRYKDSQEQKSTTQETEADKADKPKE